MGFAFILTVAVVSDGKLVERTWRRAEMFRTSIPILFALRKCCFGNKFQVSFALEIFGIHVNSPLCVEIWTFWRGST
jgi:hypothetical protein